MVRKKPRHPSASSAGPTPADVCPVAIPRTAFDARLKSNSRSDIPSNGFSANAGSARSPGSNRPYALTMSAIGARGPASCARTSSSDLPINARLSDGAGSGKRKFAMAWNRTPRLLWPIANDDDAGHLAWERFEIWSLFLRNERQYGRPPASLIGTSCPNKKAALRDWKLHFRKPALPRRVRQRHACHGGRRDRAAWGQARAGPDDAAAGSAGPQT